jgi:hypothetical protein
LRRRDLPPGGGRSIMAYQTGDFPVYADGHDVGSVRVAQDGLMTVFECACDYRSGDVLRLAAVCPGRTATLGVLNAGSVGRAAPEKSVIRKTRWPRWAFRTPLRFIWPGRTRMSGGGKPSESAETRGEPAADKKDRGAAPVELRGRSRTRTPIRRRSNRTPITSEEETGNRRAGGLVPNGQSGRRVRRPRLCRLCQRP